MIMVYKKIICDRTLQRLMKFSLTHVVNYEELASFVSIMHEQTINIPKTPTSPKGLYAD